MMGVIADRTHTRWGKYRPYLLWIAAPFAIAGIYFLQRPTWGQRVSWYGLMSLTS